MIAAIVRISLEKALFNVNAEMYLYQQILRGPSGFDTHLSLNGTAYRVSARLDL